MEHTDRRVIDLHCDALLECFSKNLTLLNNSLHFSLNRLPAGYRLCQAMAVFIPDSLRGDAAEEYFDDVCGVFRSQMGMFSGQILPVTDTSAIGRTLEKRRFAAILTAEGGGAALNGKLGNVRRFYDLGVRMIALTWNAGNDLCGGCATDLGFTDLGRAVVREMERVGVAADVSHLSDRAFWELCDMAERPFAASHSNARAVCNHRRNLTDDMFKEIARRDGVVGLNYTKSFIREDGENGTVDDLIRHAHHFLALGGEDALALGSDFDGTHTPDYLNGIDRIGYLAESLERSGIPAGTVDKILYKNAERFFKRLAEETGL